MTNERNLFITPAVIKKIFITTFERKKMSTKTLRKRIALVAVAALGFGVVTGVAATAAATASWSCQNAYDNSGSNCTQVGGGQVELQLDSGTNDKSYNVVATGGTILAVNSGNSGSGHDAYDYLNGSSYANGVRFYSNDGNAFTHGEYLYITVSVPTSGSLSVSATPIASNGAPGAVVTQTVKVITATSTSVSAANSTVAVTESCDNGSSASADRTYLNNYAVGPMYYKGDSASVLGSNNYNYNTYVCVIARDGNGKLITSSGSKIYISTDIGGLDGSTTTRLHQINNDNVVESQIVGDGLNKGTANITATIVDSSGAVATLKTTYSFYGKPDSIALTPVGYSAQSGKVGTTYLANIDTSKNYLDVVDNTSVTGGSTLISGADNV